MGGVNNRGLGLNACWADFRNDKKINKINEKFDYVIELQPTYVFRTSGLLKKSINLLVKNKKFDSLISIASIQDTSHPDFVILEKNKKLIFKKSATKFNRHFLKPVYKPIGLILMTKFKQFLKTKDMLTRKILGFKIEDKKQLHDINHYLDLKIAKRL